MQNPTRYPELRNTDELLRTWASLIRTLELRDLTQNYSDINGIVKKVSDDYTISDNDGVIFGDASGGSFDVYLPSAVRFTSRIIRFKAVGGSFVVHAQGTQQVEGGSTITVSNTTQLISDGANWFIIGGN